MAPNSWQGKLEGMSPSTNLKPNHNLTPTKDTCRDCNIAAPIFQIVSDRRGNHPPHPKSVPPTQKLT